MKNKEFKLLVENWRKNFISESYDEDDNESGRRFDSGTSESEIDSSHEQFKMDYDGEFEMSEEQKDAEIQRFASMMNVSVEDLRDFVYSQAFSGGVEELESGEVLNPETGDRFGDEEEVH